MAARRKVGIAVALSGGLGFSARPVSAQGYEAAVGRYQDETLTALIGSVSAEARENLADTPGVSTRVKLGATVRDVKFLKPGDLLEQQLNGKDRLREASGTVSIDQDFGVGQTVGILAGGTRSPLARGRTFGLRTSRWWLEETLQSTFSVRRSFSDEESVTFTDTDGRRVQTLDHKSGWTYEAGITELLTPTTILRGHASRVQAADRPDAWSLSGEIRQYLAATASAVHFGLTHYENVGSIEPITTYGEVIADSAQVEWHQRLLNSMILAGGYRYYLETETPRAEDAPLKRIGSDSIFGSVRLRVVAGPWTDDVPEAFVFFDRYRSNAPNRGLLVGLGARFPM